MANILERGRSRRRWYIVAAVAAVTFCSTLAGIPQADAAQADDWTITSSNSTADVEPGVKNYRLYNRTNKKAVVYGEREYGINLVWGGSAGSANIRFERQSGTGGLQYDTPVAIHVDRGGYLKYEERTYGINLVWSSSPVYQWRIRGGQGVIKVGAPVSIYNSVENDVMVYAERPFGINLRWLKDTQSAQVQNAQPSLTFRLGSYREVIRCTGRVVWKLTPVRLTGSTGTATAFTVDRTFDQFSRLVGPDEYACDFTASAGAVRTGTWRVEVSTGAWTASCEVTLTASLSNPVNFKDLRPGCVNGIGFP